MTLVSIILPAYNAAEFISETIQSVLRQTYSDWELIIINDGSKDNTRSIIENFSAADPRIKIINKENSGVSVSRNQGISISKGEYIAFLDADDVWLDTNLEEKINFLKNEDVDVIYSTCEVIDELSRSTGKILVGSHNPSLNDILYLKGNYLTAPSGIVLKKKVLNSVGNFDVNLSNNADQDLWMRILFKQHKVKLLDKPLWKYRMHKKNMSGNINTLERDSIYMLEKAARNKIYRSRMHKQKSFSKLYLMLAGSWWKNGNNKARAIYFVLRSIISYPPIIADIIR